MQAHPVLKGLLGDAQYLGRYGRRLTTLDQHRARRFNSLISVSPKTDFYPSVMEYVFLRGKVIPSNFELMPICAKGYRNVAQRRAPTFGRLASIRCMKPTSDALSSAEKPVSSASSRASAIFSTSV